ncbi:recombinase family protein, partial [Arcanobacterium canis]
MILTKSISRFARNTVDLLASVRKLKTLGVAIRFEREG